MSDMTKAVVVAVGPEAGLGGALCKRLARECSPGVRRSRSPRPPCRRAECARSLSRGPARRRGGPEDDDRLARGTQAIVGP